MLIKYSLCHLTDNSKARHSIRRKMSQEKTKLVDKCFQHNRFMRLLPTGDQCIIAEAMHEEEDPVWPWISDSSGNCYMNINHISP